MNHPPSCIFEGKALGNNASFVAVTLHVAFCVHGDQFFSICS